MLWRGRKRETEREGEGRRESERESEHVLEQFIGRNWPMSLIDNTIPLKANYSYKSMSVYKGYHSIYQRDQQPKGLVWFLKFVTQN